MSSLAFTVGDLVFAKIKGYPYWPAVVTDIENSHNKVKCKYKVLFFGTHDRGSVSSEMMLSYMDNREKLEKSSKKNNFLAACQEIAHYKKGKVHIDLDPDSSAIDQQNVRKYIDHFFASVMADETKTDNPEMFHFTHVPLFEGAQSCDVCEWTCKGKTFHDYLSNLKNEKGVVTVNFPKKDMTHSNNRIESTSKLMKSFFSVAQKFEEYHGNEGSVDGSYNLESQNKRKSLERYITIVRDIEEFLYEGKTIFAPESEDSFNEPSCSNKSSKEITLGELILSAVMQIRDNLHEDLTTLNSTYKDLTKNSSSSCKENNKLSELKRLLDQLEVDIKSISPKSEPSTSGSGNKCSEVIINIPNPKNNKFSSKPSGSGGTRKRSDEKLDIPEQSKKKLRCNKRPKRFSNSSTVQTNVDILEPNTNNLSIQSVDEGESLNINSGPTVEILENNTNDLATPDELDQAESHSGSCSPVIPPSTSEEPLDTSQLDLEALPYATLSKENIGLPLWQYGFIGISEIGCVILMNLLRTKHDVCFYNGKDVRHFELVAAGGEPVLSPSKVVQKTDIIFCCADNEDEVNRLMFGPLSALQNMMPAQILIEMSGIGYEVSQKIHNAIQLLGGRYLHILLRGDLQNAEAGTLTIIAAGDRDVYDSCYSSFGAFASRSIYVGRKMKDFFSK